MKLVSFLILLLLLLLVVDVYAQGVSLFQKRQFTGSSGNMLPYRVLFPDNYDPEGSYPLVLFLHGSGERGDDNEAQLTHGARLFADSVSRRKHPAIVVFPQCPAGDSWANIRSDPSLSKDEWDFPFGDHPTQPLQSVMELLDELSETEAVDPDRVYAAGLSMGGFGTFELLARLPDRFAAAAPICGGGNELLVPLYAGNTSLWIFHGDRDEAVPVEYSRRIYQALREAGAKVKYTEYPDVGHNSWDPAFAEPDFLEWLFSETLKVPEGIRYQDEIFQGVRRKTHRYAVKEGQELDLDIYLPRKDEARDRPLLLYVHGGGFSGGARNEPSQRQFARKMARRGFAVASMSYRLTMKGKSFSCDQPAPNKILTFQLAVEDIRDATNFLVQRNEALGIHTGQIVLIGSSAGGEAVLHAAFWGDEHLLPGSPRLPDGFRYGGIISLAGAISDTSVINAASAIPTQLFHGTCDPLVPYATAPHHYCREDAPGYLVLHGGRAVAEQLRAHGKPFYLVTGCHGGHEWNSLPISAHLDLIVDFLQNDILRGEFRQLHRRFTQEGTCELVKGIKECEEQAEGVKP